MPQGKPLNAKLFIEGIEVPFTGATLTHTVNQASIAYFDLVPHEDIQHIKPRTLVQLFVRQYQESRAEKESGSERFPFVLSWEGEVFGYTIGKNPTSRSFSVSAIDFSGYWDNALTYFFNLTQSLAAGMDTQSYNSMEYVDSKKAGIPPKVSLQAQTSYYESIFKKVWKQNPNADLLDLFIAVYKDVAGINEFFADAEARLRITDRFAIHSSKRLTKLINQQKGIEYFLNVANGFSGYTTLRTVVQEFMGMIFHDFVTVPFPSRVPADVSKPLPSTEGRNLTIGSFAFKPNLFMMPPPLCNVFFPDEYSSFSYSRNFFEEPTRLIYSPELPGQFGDAPGKIYLRHVYAPESFRHFMSNDAPFPPDLVFDPKEGQSTTDNDLKVTSEVAKLRYLKENNIADSGRSDYQSEEEKKKFSEVGNNKTRLWQFLTNEERIKGIFLAREGMVPFSSSFRKALDQYVSGDDFNLRIAKYFFYKKRFKGRQLQITSHLKMSVVPGFPVLILDHENPEMSITAYCTSVTHRIYATEGGHTNVTLGYARTVGEQNTASDTGGASYLVPPWFEETILGKIDTPPTSEVAPDKVASQGKTHVSPDGLTGFYNTLLGGESKKSSYGGSPLTTFFAGERTLLGATIKLASEYKTAVRNGSSSVQEYIAAMTNRQYVRMEDAMKFIGAAAVSKKDAKYLVFDGAEFSREGQRDGLAIRMKRKVIKKYAESLLSKRGFRG